MAFLSWLMSQGYSLNDIAQAMAQLGDLGRWRNSTPI